MRPSYLFSSDNIEFNKSLIYVAMVGAAIFPENDLNRDDDVETVKVRSLYIRFTHTVSE